MRKHLLSLQKRFQFSGVSAEHTGSKKNKSVADLGLSAESPNKAFDYTGWTLIMFDLNGTILHRQWLGYKKGYTKCVMRPGTHAHTRTL